jgi:hypothetical protein
MLVFNTAEAVHDMTGGSNHQMVSLDNVSCSSTCLNQGVELVHWLLQVYEDVLSQKQLTNLQAQRGSNVQMSVFSCCYAGY